MQHKLDRLGNIFGVLWIGEIQESHLAVVTQKTEEARRLSGRPLVSLSFITKDSRFPSASLATRMFASQHELSAHQSSSHLLLIGVSGSIVTRTLSAMSFLMKGAGGRMYAHKNLQEALAKARELGDDLPAADDQIIAWFKRAGFPTD